MGSKSSKLAKKQEAIKKEEFKKELVESQIKQVESLEKAYIESLQNPSIQQLTTIQNIKDTLTITETVKNQISRGGKQLSKTDLITIILVLDTTQKYCVAELNKLTISDLNQMIRTIIYSQAIQTVLLQNNDFQEIYQDNEYKNEDSVKIEEIIVQDNIKNKTKEKIIETKLVKYKTALVPINNSKQLVVANSKKNIENQLSIQSNSVIVSHPTKSLGRIIRG